MEGFIDADNPWGFDSVFVPIISEDQNWITWSCKLPSKDSSDIFLSDHFWERAFAISATLNITSKMIHVFDGRTESSNPQLFSLDLRTDRGENGGALSVELTREFVKWISTQKETVKHPGIEPAMTQAYEYMRGAENFGRVLAMFRKPFWVNLSVPGNASRLDPDDYDFELGEDNNPIIEPYRLLSHNVDSPIQQLTLLMGIAAMHDLQRKYIGVI